MERAPLLQLVHPVPIRPARAVKANVKVTESSGRKITVSEIDSSMNFTCAISVTCNSCVNH